MSYVEDIKRVHGKECSDQHASISSCVALGRGCADPGCCCLWTVSFGSSPTGFGHHLRAWFFLFEFPLAPRALKFKKSWGRSRTTALCEFCQLENTEHISLGRLLVFWGYLNWKSHPSWLTLLVHCSCIVTLLRLFAVSAIKYSYDNPILLISEVVLEWFQLKFWFWLIIRIFNILSVNAEVS